jgi:hypothetical protein
MIIGLVSNSLLNFPISPYRAEGPNWIDEIQLKTSLCQSKLDKDDLVGLTFFPHWPTENPHAYGLTEPTTNEISCAKLLNKVQAKFLQKKTWQFRKFVSEDN